jgi:molybdate transport system regulatory protein
MKVGARNKLTAKVTEVKRGTVMGEVKVKLTVAGDMASVMTLESIDELGLKPGDEVEVVVKAVNVLLLKN